MVSFARLATTYLAFAASPARRSGQATPHHKRKSKGPLKKNTAEKSPRPGNGRRNRDKFQHKTGRDQKDGSTKRGELLAPPPPLTLPGGPFPSYFTCRHTYEAALTEELRRAISENEQLKVSSPSPGLVQALSDSAEVTEKVAALDPIYALQSIPECVVIEAPSIKQLAVQALKAMEIDQDSPESERSRRLRQAPKGSLTVHSLVPGMFKGQRDPVLIRRSEKVAEEVVKLLKKGYPCARQRKIDDGEGAAVSDMEEQKERWLFQLLLFSPEVMAVSLTKCTSPANLPDATWPNIWHPAGIANVDIVEVMPSSAYRKLLEALECMRLLPPCSHHPRDDIPPVVDLGACPGGWTAALRRLGAKVIGVDRSELVDELMQDEMVEFVKGDAFSYEPPWAEDGASAQVGTWMVSDVIAYPERVAELLERWCGGKWAGHCIVTAKFQGTAIPWDALDAAAAVAVRHGYSCRIKHFFNNKNEVTLMVSEEFETANFGPTTNESFPGKPMYPIALAN